MRNSWSPSAECLIEVFESYLRNNDSALADQDFLQGNAATKWTANSCYFSDLLML